MQLSYRELKVLAYGAHKLSMKCTTDVARARTKHAKAVVEKGSASWEEVQLSLALQDKRDVADLSAKLDTAIERAETLPLTDGVAVSIFLSLHEMQTLASSARRAAYEAHANRSRAEKKRARTKDEQKLADLDVSIAEATCEEAQADQLTEHIEKMIKRAEESIRAIVGPDHDVADCLALDEVVDLAKRVLEEREERIRGLFGIEYSHKAEQQPRRRFFGVEDGLEDA